MTKTILLSESIDSIQEIIKESARNSERLIELKGRLIRRNAKADMEFMALKGEDKRMKSKSSY